MTSRKLKILFLSAEVSALAKVGGLADVAAGLPRELRAMGHDVRIAMPAYKLAEKNATGLTPACDPFDVVGADGKVHAATARVTEIEGGVPVYLVGTPAYFTTATASHKVYTLEADPYIFFCRAVMEMVPKLEGGWTPDILHCNDWHTGLAPVYLETFYRSEPTLAQTRTVFSIHNLAFPGEFDAATLGRANLPEYLFSYDKLEWFGRTSLLKGGLAFSDRVNTVSKTYASEIQTAEYGNRMDGLLRFLHSEGRLSGIVNGIDTHEFNPETDKRIPARFSAAKPAGKAKCKSALQKECGFKQDKTAPVYGLITRLSDQKGLDLVEEVLPHLLAEGAQFVALGAGEPHYERLLKRFAKSRPEQVFVNIGFDADFAQRIYSGCDLFLMPSRFEPCGLGQLIALRYGTIPVARRTGGLTDTVTNYNPRTGAGNGFCFEEYSADAFATSIDRSLCAFRDTQKWSALHARALGLDFSWSKPAKAYVDLYRHALDTSRLADAA